MGVLFVVFVVVMVFAFRWGRRLLPVLEKVGKWGDDVGGWTIFYMFGGVGKVGGILTGGARAVLWSILIIGALFDWTLRILLISVLAWRFFSKLGKKKAHQSKLNQSGLTKNELEVIDDALRQTFIAMGLVSKGAEPIPPNCFRWVKRPVLIGGRPLRNKFRYDCLIEPAPGRSVAELSGFMGRGLDASEDRLRDALNATLRAARGRKVSALKKAKMMPGPFVLTTLEHATKNGEKIGLGRLSLWTTDPFRRPINWPYPTDKPVIKKFSDPCPVGIYRNNTEAKVQLNVMTGIMGSNGSGKSSVVKPRLIAAAWTDAIIICIALKGPRDYAALKCRYAGGVVITDKNIAANVIKWAKAEIDRRNALPVSELNKLPDILLLVDEGQELKSEIALLISPVKLGRAAKVWTHLVTQYAPSSVRPEDGGCPTTLLRELKRRDSGRIEGNHSNAVVAVGDRVTKSAGPHLIPPGDRWNGVLFSNDGDYIRSYWVTSDEDDSQLAKVAKCVPSRPNDPCGFREALEKRTDAPSVASIAPEWPEDGAERAADGSAKAVNMDQVSEEILNAFEEIWPKGGKRNPPSGRILRAEINKTISGARQRMEQRIASGEIDTDSDLLDSLLSAESFIIHPADDFLMA